MKRVLKKKKKGRRKDRKQKEWTDAIKHKVGEDEVHHSFVAGPSLRTQSVIMTDASRGQLGGEFVSAGGIMPTPLTVPSVQRIGVC